MGDFTFEAFTTPLSEAERSTWVHKEMKRVAEPLTYIHDQTEIDGHVFLQRTTFNDKNEIVERHQIRADRVRA